jgi:hypothetical protein
MNLVARKVGGTMKIQITGDDARIEIEVMGRSHPGSDDYWDGNWLTSSLKINIPGYHVSFICDIRTDELQDFLDELKTLYEQFRGKAQFKNIDNYLHFECEMDKLGKVKWCVETCYPAGYGAVLKFEFESDQSYLPRLMQELNGTLHSYPIIGKP